jgi:hypothetical protein
MALSNSSLHITTNDMLESVHEYDMVNETSSYADSNTDCLYDYDDESENYTVADRALQNLSKPHYIIALILGTVALLANLLSLAAVFYVHRKWSSHFRLLLSLMTSDIVVDLSVIIFVVNTVMNPLAELGVGSVTVRLQSRCGFIIFKALNTTALNVTLLNLMGMALDHYLAIIKPLHHCTLLDKQRTTIMIISFWLLAFVSGFSNLLSPLWNIKSYLTSQYNYCEFAWLSAYQEEYTLFAIALVCFCLMVFMYIRIYCQVRSRVQRHNRGKVSSSRRALFTTLLILGSFIVCWLPTCLFQISLLVIVNVKPEMVNGIFRCLIFVDKYLFDLVILNTLCGFHIVYSARYGSVLMLPL